MAIHQIDRINKNLLVFRDKAWKVNATAIVTAAGVVLVDTFPTPYDAREIVKYVDEELKSKISLVINTHHHWDHALGGQVYSDARFISHKKCKERMIAYRDEVMTEAARRRRLADLNPTYPQETITESTTLNMGDTTIELLYKGPAHTDNDLLVYLPENKALITADVFVPHTLYPISLNSGGSISNWMQILRALPKEYPRVETVIPGHFAPATFKEMAELASYMEALLDEVARTREEGYSMKEALDEVNLDKYSHFRNFQRFHYANIRAAWRFQEKNLEQATNFKPE